MRHHNVMFAIRLTLVSLTGLACYALVAWLIWG